MNPEKILQKGVFMIKRAFLILLCLIFMIFHADLVTKGAVSGLLLWYSSVVPALFPFMVLSSVLSASGGVQALMRPFPVIFRFAGLSADGWYVLLTGLLCGAPWEQRHVPIFTRKGGSAPGRRNFSLHSAIIQVPCFSQVSSVPCLLPRSLCHILSFLSTHLYSFSRSRPA